ncbi:uncharacterized protein HMPREF1541_00536 [Cyphellophora europaea CBS 101466]|uniref:Acyltransferase MbtK/IucB-like conserved domain-containing protein n=1 Tax=Cyphellophora europaea (strain CBS 101466) TaxID=1220924 RepID=W2SCC6_CYPE1|nr:uncharacterized protein HMPREF1541_00536 [Cyphellophora europaea CBS 101466]ETN46352.1 hypothetical protein HMPREF1541_00536 [Cyphellophora europaea CBS 101466]
MKPSTKSPLAASAVAKLRLPHPYYTTYYATPAEEQPSGVSQSLQVQKDEHEQRSSGAEPLEEELHNGNLRYTSLAAPEGNLPPDSNNSPWARARRSPSTRFSWGENSTPTLGQAWLIIYAIFTQAPEHEYFRLELSGSNTRSLRESLLSSTLAIPHPSPDRGRPEQHSTEGASELLVLRGNFWQGAGSPIGSRSAWIPLNGGSSNTTTTNYTMTTKFPQTPVHRFHPRRAVKPAPGSVIYSRYIPSLDEHFSMIALDYENPEHLDMFHNWQNDPRVAKGWNETGDLEHHRTYLRNLHEDPHVLTVLARFEDICFAYFEIYWAKEDHLGAHYPAGDFDRGRHALVGDERFRGRYRVTAWWSATMHYIFLDDPRTGTIVGEPKATNSSVLAYDFMHGFSMDKVVDLAHKRSALMKCSRERFFQLCPLDHAGGYIGGTGIQLPAKL